MFITNNQVQDHQKLKFLIIAEALTDQQLMTTVLTARFDCEVSGAEVEEAETILARQRFDLILLNPDLLGREDLEALQRIRQEGLNHQTPLVAISSLPKGVTPWSEATIEAWLFKPFTPLELETTIKRLLPSVSGDNG